MDIKIVDFTDFLYVETNQHPDEGLTLSFNGDTWRAYMWRAIYDDSDKATYYCHYVREREYKDKTR
jgi:hypothetical protein